MNDADLARGWLRTLALDVIEHDNCHGCRINAAIALEETGQIGELRQRDLRDPREGPGFPRVGRSRLTEAQAYQAAFRFVLQYRERERQPGPESLDLMLTRMEPASGYAPTNDPAAWSDWQVCVEKTLRGDPLPGFGDSTADA